MNYFMLLDRDSLLRVLALCSCRDVLALACTCKEFNSQLQDDDLWRLLAEQKWGPHVGRLARVVPGGWATWTRHRLSSSSHPLSPLDLVQEHYQDCPFQHMVACLLCSRTTGGPVVREAIRLFLALYPTPSAVIQAADHSLLEVLHPLGLQATRLAAVRALATNFLATQWQDPSEFRYCGKFVSDSWRIFCRGHHSLAGIEDKNLQRYLHWCLHGSVGGKTQRQQQKPEDSRKRKAEAPVEVGTLRSGRPRNAMASGGRGTKALPAGERRLTRAAAAVAAAAAPAAKSMRVQRG